MNMGMNSSSSSDLERAKLPPELLQLIVENVLPANSQAIVSTSHSSAKTLLALTGVSRITYKLASKLLRQRCLCVDSSRRLIKVLLCMNRLTPTLPPTFSLRSITSLYLDPFERSLEDQPTAIRVRELFFEVCQTLRRLVVRIPFSSLDRLDDRLNVRRTLRDGFEQLTGLEEFVCLEEYPALSVPEEHTTDVWRLWPELKRLCLFNVPINNHWLWWDIATLMKLQHVVLARPQGLDVANIKDEYFHKLPRDDVRLDRQIKIVLMEAAYEMPKVKTARWEGIDPQGRMTVEQYDVPTAFYGDETTGELVTGWVRRGALDGNLWEWEGLKIVDGP